MTDRVDIDGQQGAADAPAKPEAGLTEWQLKAKARAMQWQAEKGEGSETQEPEDETITARAARLRREANTDPSGAKRSNNLPTSLPLWGTPVRNGPSPAAQGRAPEPMSLAAFIGGRATAPRLNKHAPQQDAYDATQYEQRKITAPHPVFGRGGIALPGLAAKGRLQAEAEALAAKVASPQQPAEEPAPAFSSGGESMVKARIREAEERRQLSAEKLSSSLVKS
ncbi:hypothetical protein PsYK624_084080 [Phanerochaete sordida]|uniref:Uncharacterized protein n=1 Tax=Phanerochaete sordida TaxID=48140 RepID=A0A9P3GCP3_9APHY|nr:hypothetical protein PsYK624_084080 [Phanerochaete sordida]